jgi:hypothetical protein
MHQLAEMLSTHEDWLMERVLEYAKRFGFTKYTSTLQEAWRLSISGLTASLCDGIQANQTVPELSPDSNYTGDPLAQFGLIEARRHRQRGVTLAMFLGLMKYYRQSYVDLLAEKTTSPSTITHDRLFIERCFDRIEVAFCHEWANIKPDKRTEELQTANRFMTNEKNTYLTAFESLSDPVLMLDKDEKLVNINHAASLLIDPAHIPGSHYYHTDKQEGGTTASGKKPLDAACIGRRVTELYPWLKPTLRILRKKPDEICECRTSLQGEKTYFEVKRSDMLDVSEKFTASIIILRNITKRTLAQAALKKTITELGQALSEVKKLSGMLPICASCKKVRDDKGYWNQVEQYVADHSEVTFSHAICPDCLRKLYPEIAEEVLVHQE